MAEDTGSLPLTPVSLGAVQCGPRFEMRLHQIKLGTLDQPHAESEWALRAYTRSTKKPKLAEPTEVPRQ